MEIFFTRMEIFFRAGPLDGTSRQWDDEFPQYMTSATVSIHRPEIA
jgi:hypothetical protein